MVCQLGFLRGDALGNGLARVVGLPVAHNVVLPFLVGIEGGLGDKLACLLGEVLNSVSIASDCGILLGVLGLDICNLLLVGGVVTIKRGNTLLMVCQLGGMGRQLCGVLGNQLAVCQLCGLGAVDLSGQRGIGVVGFGVQLGEVGFCLVTALFQFV